MKRLVILGLSTDFTTDPRIYKQAISARDSGWDVTICCYSNFQEHTVTKEEGCTVERIPYHGVFIRIPGIPPTILINLIDRVILRHKRKKLDFTTAEKRPFKSAFKISDTCVLYLWCFVLYVLSQIHLFMYAKKYRADVYHSTDLITLLTGVLLKTTQSGKLVYDSHEMWIDSMEDYTKTLYKLLSFYEKSLIKHADVVTTVNSHIANELSRRYNIPIPTVVMNAPHLQPEPDHTQHTDIRVIYQGRYVRNRGIETAIRGANVVDGVSVYMRGIDAYGEHEPYVAELKEINPKTKFLSPVDMKDLVQSLGDFDIGVVPYIANNFNNKFASPNKTFEYMMAGMAVVTSDLPVQKEILERCGAGKTYNQTDPSDLARVIREMIPYLDQYKKNARRCAEREFNWEVQGKKLIDIYEKMIA